MNMISVDWPAIMQELERRLATTLRRDVSEEDICQELWQSMVQGGVVEASIASGVPHPRLSGRSVDFRLGPPANLVWLEVKYHRRTPSGRNQPRTQKYGDLITDMYRLRLALPPGSSFLLYLTDQEMERYLAKNAPGLLQAFAQWPFLLDEALLAGLPSTALIALTKGVLTNWSPAGMAEMHDRLRKLTGQAVVEHRGQAAGHSIFLFLVR